MTATSYRSREGVIVTLRIIDGYLQVRPATAGPARPIAVMFMGVLGHAGDYESARSIVARVMGAVPSGSYLALWDGNDTNEDLNRLTDDYKKTGAVPYIQRSIEQIGHLFDGLEMIDPGLVSITLWRPEPSDVGTVRPLGEATGGVARKD